MIIQRSLATPLHQLESVVPEPGFCRMVALGNAFSATHLVGSGFPSHVARRLEHDIDLLHRAVRSVHQGAGHAQLFVTRSDECRKFHVDYYRLRVLVTYVGPGTEIALERGLNRAALGTLGDDVEGANRCILSPNVQPMRAPGGAVVVLKGARWGSGLPAVHRSPPLAGPRRARLVLKLTVE